MSPPTTPGSDSGADDAEQVYAAVTVDKPYHTKRPHKKSRTGCRNCKLRKVKCDETRPVCKACALRHETCSYLDAPTLAAKSCSTSACRTASGQRQREGHRKPGPLERRSAGSKARDQLGVTLTAPALVIQPGFRPPGVDAGDMSLLWFYSTYTFTSFTADGISLPLVDEIMKIRIVQHAFTSPFLMHSILGIAALHVQSMGGFGDLRISPTKALIYQQKAFEGYRRAIQDAKPETYPGLLACSLLLCALSSQHFRDPDAKPLFILDWITVWRGIGAIMELVTPEALLHSGIAELFFRPRVDLESAAQYIPNNLLFMVKSIQPSEKDYPYTQDYYKTLRYFGSLYQELAKGFSPTLILRIIVFFTLLPDNFIELCRRRQPRALVIIAHYLVFAKLAKRVWWMYGIGDREIDSICSLLDDDDDDWASLLRVPRSAVGLDDSHEIAKLLLNNRVWEPPTPEPEAYKNAPPPEKAPVDLFPEDFYRNDGQFRYLSPVVVAMRKKWAPPLENYASLFSRGPLIEECEDMSSTESPEGA